MNSKLVSMVIPVFNTPDELLCRCVSSVLSQTHKAIEVVIIDDGSDDECKNTLRELASSDERIRLYLNQAAGVSASRNAGICAASADWLAFVDSDDEVAPTFVEDALELALQEDADFVVGGVISTVEGSDPADFTSGDFRVIRQQDEISLLRRQTLGRIDVAGADASLSFHRGPYARIVRTDLARKILFREDLQHSEDIIFNFEYLSLSSTIVISQSVWYRYYRYRDSLSHKPDMKTRLDNQVAFEAMPVEPLYLNAKRSFLIGAALEAGERCVEAQGLFGAWGEVKSFWEAVGLEVMCRELDSSEFQFSSNRKLIMNLLAKGHMRLAYTLFAGKRALRIHFGKA